MLGAVGLRNGALGIPLRGAVDIETNGFQKQDIFIN